VPIGMTFQSPEGVLSGTPTWPANYYFTVVLQDAGEPALIDTMYGVKVPVVTEFDFVCGDANADGTTNVTDAVYIIQWIFAGGPPPAPLAAGDVNCDQSANITDAVYLILYIFAGGPAPCVDCQ